jgi:hypothetical protein
MKRNTCTASSASFGAMVLILLLLAVLPASSQNFAPDRPGFSTGTFTMLPNMYTLEAGFEFVDNASANPRLPGLNFRYGLTSKMEISLSWSGLQVDKQDGEAEYDLPVPALKYRVLQRDALEVTFVGALAVSGDSDLDPFAGFMFELDLDGAFGLFGGGAVCFVLLCG